MTLGGWAISPQCFAWILDNVPSGSKVLEFGSGMGTGELVKHFDMTSIEQDSFWMNGFTGSRYIYAPIVDDWYSWEALENGNLENDYFLIDLYVCDLTIDLEEIASNIVDSLQVKEVQQEIHPRGIPGTPIAQD